MRMNRSQKGKLKKTTTICSNGNEDMNKQLCEIDVPQNSDDASMSPHKMRELFVVLQRLPVTSDDSNDQDHETAIKNNNPEKTLENRIGADKPKVRLRTSPRFCKNLNKTEICPSKTTDVSSNNSSLCKTSDLINENNNVLTSAICTGASSGFSPISESSKNGSENNNSTGDKCHNLLSNEVLVNTQNIKRKIFYSSDPVSDHLIKERNDHNYSSEGRISAENKVSLKRGSETQEKKESSSDTHDDLTNMPSKSKKCRILCGLQSETIILKRTRLSLKNELPVDKILDSTSATDSHFSTQNIESKTHSSNELINESLTTTQRDGKVLKTVPSKEKKISNPKKNKTSPHQTACIITSNDKINDQESNAVIDVSNKLFSLNSSNSDKNKDIKKTNMPLVTNTLSNKDLDLNSKNKRNSKRLNSKNKTNSSKKLFNNKSISGADVSATSSLTPKKIDNSITAEQNFEIKTTINKVIPSTLSSDNLKTLDQVSCGNEDILDSTKSQVQQINISEADTVENEKNNFSAKNEELSSVGNCQDECSIDTTENENVDGSRKGPLCDKDGSQHVLLSPEINLCDSKGGATDFSVSTSQQIVLKDCKPDNVEKERLETTESEIIAVGLQCKVDSSKMSDEVLMKTDIESKNVAEVSEKVNTHFSYIKKKIFKKKCRDKKERKKLKLINTFEREITDSYSIAKPHSQTEYAESQNSDLQSELNESSNTCDSSVDSLLPKDSSDESLAITTSIDLIAASSSTNVVPDFQNQAIIVAEPISVSPNPSVEYNTSKNTLQAIEKNEITNFDDETNISSSSNKRHETESEYLSSSDHSIESIGSSVEGSSSEIVVDQSSNIPVSSNNHESDLLNECSAATSAVSADVLTKKCPSSSATETINSFQEKSLEIDAVVKSNNKEDSDVKKIISDITLQEDHAKVIEVITQSESKSINTKPLSISGPKSSPKFNTTLGLLDALNSTKIASMPACKAKMAYYLLKQLASDSLPMKPEHDTNLHFSQSSFNKIKKTNSDPDLCLASNFENDKNLDKMFENSSTTKPDNVASVSSSTSIQENFGEHTFKIPKNAAPKARKKPLTSKCNTFLKPKTNENNIVVQRMICNLKAKSKYSKLFSSGNIPRRIAIHRLQKVVTNKNEKKTVNFSSLQTEKTVVENQSISTIELKNVTDFNGSPEGKTIEKTQSSATDSYASSVNCLSPSVESEEQTGSKLDTSGRNSAYINRSMKKLSLIQNTEKNADTSKLNDFANKSKKDFQVKIINTDKKVEENEKEAVEKVDLTSSTKVASYPIASSRSEREVTVSMANNKSAINLNKANVYNKSISENVLENKCTSAVPLGSDFMSSSLKSTEPNVLVDSCNKSKNLFLTKDKKDFSNKINGSVGDQATENIFSSKTSISFNELLRTEAASDKPSVQNTVKSGVKESQSIDCNDSCVDCGKIFEDVKLDAGTAKLRNTFESDNKDTLNFKSEKSNVPPKQLNNSSTTDEKNLETQDEEVTDNPNVDRIQSPPQDSSTNQSSSSLDPRAVIVELFKLNDSVSVAIDNYNKSINNEEINKELRNMIPKDGTTPNPNPNRPPEWFLKFIANFRKQELWKLHQMFKIHDHLMRTESAKLNMLEKLYEDLKAKHGITD